MYVYNCVYVCMYSLQHVMPVCVPFDMETHRANISHGRLLLVGRDQLGQSLSQFIDLFMTVVLK